MTENLKDKAVKGTRWSAIENVTQYAVSFVVSIMLARLLSPEDYGLLGMTAIFTAICSALINGGFSNALIRKFDVSDDDYSTAFIINIGMSLLLYIVMFACAPLLATFFGRQELVALTRVLSLNLIIGASTIVQQTRLAKRIDFKTQTKISLIASISSGAIGIAMAISGCGVWSLVAQILSSSFLQALLLWTLSKWTIRIHFSYASFKDLFGYGWKMMSAGLIDTVWKQLTQFVVGKFYNTAALGQYTRSEQFAQLPSSSITNIIQRVSFPVLSEIQNDSTRMLYAYRRIIKTTMFVTAVCLLSLAAVSEPLIFCLIGEQWHDAATYLPLLCLISSTYPLHALNLNMLQVLGRSDLFLGLEIVKKIIGLIPLFVGAFVGIMPMLYTNLAFTILTYFMNSFYSKRLIGYSSWMQIRDIVPSYILGLVIALPVFFLKYLPLGNWIILPLQIALGAGIFFSVCTITKNEEYSEVKAMALPAIRNLISNLRGLLR